MCVFCSEFFVLFCFAFLGFRILGAGKQASGFDWTTEAGGGLYWRRLSYSGKRRIERDEDNWDGGHPVLFVLITRVATWRR